MIDAHVSTGSTATIAIATVAAWMRCLAGHTDDGDPIVLTDRQRDVVAGLTREAPTIALHRSALLRTIAADTDAAATYLTVSQDLTRLGSRRTFELLDARDPRSSPGDEA